MGGILKRVYKSECVGDGNDGGGGSRRKSLQWSEAAGEQMERQKEEQIS